VLIAWSNVLAIYRARLRARTVLVQEIFAVLGIAVGVALLFASQVASTSLNGSVRQLTSEVVGDMQLQLDARGSSGFDQRLLGDVQRIPGVLAALPVLEQQANMVGPRGQAPVDLIGTDPRFARAGSPLLRHFSYTALARQRALAVPAPVAEEIGAGPLQPVTLQIGGRNVSALLGAELRAADIGALVHSPVAIAPLAYAQDITGLRGRVTRIFVQVASGRARQVQAGLTRLAAGHLNVEPADFDATLFARAAAPANQSEGLFAGISALVGFMFAYSAMLMTMHLRQDLIVDLRRNGATRLMTVQTLLFDAFVLGGLASLLGLALGALLSSSVFQGNPGYLSFAFAVGSERIVTWQCFAFAVAAGMLAACIGVLTPLRDILSRPRRHVPGFTERLLRLRSIGMVAGGLACLAATTIILLLAPQSAVLGCVILVLALGLLLPILLDLIVVVFDLIERRLTLTWLHLAVIELREPSSRGRSLAIAATGAIAVFGSVAIQGAHSNLQRGLNHLFGDVTDVADLWIAPPGTQNLLATAPFQNPDASTLARIPGVAAVGLYRAGFLTYGDRRLWVLAPPSIARHPIPPSQLVAGDLALATARVREGGWAVVSQVVAAQHHLHIGQRFVLPSANPTALRIAALVTNLGWPPGAIILNPGDYTRAWGTASPTAYNVTLLPGYSSSDVRREAQRALEPTSGLSVQTAHQRDQLQQAASRQGLSRLTQIATLVLIATVLAMATAMGSMIWQRRSRIARMKVQGYTRRVLWYWLLCESALLLGAGCSIGAAFGLFGQLLISHALMTVTGFPIVITVGASFALLSFTLVSAVAVLIVALPGFRVASVRPSPII